MDKLTCLYRAFMKGYDSANYCPSERYVQLINMMQSDLDVERFLCEEALFNELLEEVKEEYFILGAKYLHGLHMELSEMHIKDN